MVLVWVIGMMFLFSNVFINVDFLVLIELIKVICSLLFVCFVSWIVDVFSWFICLEVFLKFCYFFMVIYFLLRKWWSLFFVLIRLFIDFCSCFFISFICWICGVKLVNILDYKIVLWNVVGILFENVKYEMMLFVNGSLYLNN